MKILHIADLHLQFNNKERWDALQEVLDIARQEDVDLLVISGDLFDSSSDAEQLYPKLRPLFSNNDFYILISPGNHDSQVFQSGYFMGNDVRLMISSSHPFILENEGVAVWSLSYEQMSEVEVLSKMQELSFHSQKDVYNILLFHGELLETFYSGEDFGDEDKQEYMAVKKSNLTVTNFDYILAGHFHTNYRVFPLNNFSSTGGYFVYPGSPVSITTREQGIRKANILEIGKPPKEIALNTKHYLSHVLELDPLQREHPITQLENFINDLQLNRGVELLLYITGYINSGRWNLTEQELVSYLENKCKQLLLTNEKVNNYFLYHEFKDLKYVLEDGLYQQIYSKLIESGYENEMQEEMMNMVIEAMVEVKS